MDDRDQVIAYFESLKSTIDFIKSDFKDIEEDEEDVDQELALMLDGLNGEIDTTIKALEITDESTCSRIAEVLSKMRATEFLKAYPNSHKQAKQKKIPWRQRFFTKASLFKALQHLFNKLSQLASGTPLSGILSDISNLFGWISGSFSSRP